MSWSRWSDIFDRRLRHRHAGARLSRLSGRTAGDRALGTRRGHASHDDAAEDRHQRIASNIERALNQAIEALGLDRRADREIGLQIEAAPGYRPEPEVAIIDADYEHERYASRFYGVVEALSATDLARNPRTRRTAMDDKLAFYRSHAFAEFILVVSLDAMRLEAHCRGADGAWQASEVRDAPDEFLVLPRLGAVCTMADVYKGVRLRDKEA